MILKDQAQESSDSQHRERWFRDDLAIIGQVALIAATPCLERNAMAAIITWDRSVRLYFWKKETCVNRDKVIEIRRKVFDDYDRTANNKKDNLFRNF